MADLKTIAELLPKLATKQLDDCLTWAFGERWTDLYLEDAIKNWNLKHGSLFKLRQLDNGTMALVANAYISRVVNLN